MLPSVRVRSCPHTDPRLWGGDGGVASRGGQGRGGKGLPTRPLRPLATLLSLPHLLLRPPHFLWSPQCSASDVTWPSPSVGKPPLATEGLAPGCRPGSGAGHAVAGGASRRPALGPSAHRSPSATRLARCPVREGKRGRSVSFTLTICRTIGPMLQH